MGVWSSYPDVESPRVADDASLPLGLFSFDDGLAIFLNKVYVSLMTQAFRLGFIQMLFVDI